MLDTQTPRRRVVIVGAGFGGLSAAKALVQAPVDVTIIDRHNYHLFQPLLYQVATASLSPAEIAQPIRSIVRFQRNTRVLLDEVGGVDTANKVVRTAAGRSIGFDYLVVATGARHSYFGKDHWEAFAPGIKSVDDATRVRAKILMAFERAEVETDKAARAALLTFVVVGGGPTGVEMAGAIAELARKSITTDFRSITPHCSRIILVEAGPRLLSTFPDALSAEAKLALEAKGVEVLLGVPVTDISADNVMVGATPIPTRTVIWGAGVRASQAGEWLNAVSDRAGRVIVNGDFSVPGHDNVFVIGDTAAFTAANGTMLPGVAPAAKQAGHYVGRLIAARAKGLVLGEAFRYADYGNMATIGHSKAVADFGSVHVKGFPAWVLWSVAHVYFLIGFRNRFFVATSWAWSYLTYKRGVRLITGGDDAAMRAKKMSEAA
ncbi:MAG: NAD(P)/FAD-dependent oxidoreductase [Alphaproteobacteria bacterium]|nr:NAD(P)/FAD-dependent oxidoreductase [Alphaproteobacteria bacterium]